MKILGAPKSCTLVATAIITNINEEKILRAFKDSGCYGEDHGSYIDEIGKALKKMKVKYKNHWSSGKYARACRDPKIKKLKVDKLKLLTRVFDKFKKGRFLVHVKVLSKPNEHTIGVHDGHVFYLDMTHLSETYYLGHHEILI